MDTMHLAFMPSHFTFPCCLVVAHTTLEVLDINIPILMMDDIIWMYEVCLKVMPLILFLTAWSFQLLKCHFNLWGPSGVPSWRSDGVRSTAVPITANDVTSV
jgi:hypothetical protein